MLQNLAYDEGLVHSFAPLGWNVNRDDDGGTLIVSRFKIVESDYFGFTAVHTKGFIGCMYVCIELRKSVKIHIFNAACTQTPLNVKIERLRFEHEMRIE